MLESVPPLIGAVTKLTSLDCSHGGKIFNQTFPAMTTCYNILTLWLFLRQKPYLSQIFFFFLFFSIHPPKSDPNEVFHSYLKPENITVSVCVSNFSLCEFQKTLLESFFLHFKMLLLVRVNHEKHMTRYSEKTVLRTSGRLAKDLY